MPTPPIIEREPYTEHEPQEESPFAPTPASDTPSWSLVKIIFSVLVVVGALVFISIPAALLLGAVGLFIVALENFRTNPHRDAPAPKPPPAARIEPGDRLH